MSHLPLLVVLFPVCGGLLNPLIAKFLPGWERRLVIGALFGSVVCAVLQLIQLLQTGEPIHYWMGGYEPPYGIEFVVDAVNGIIILTVALISLLTALYSTPFENTHLSGWLRASGYYTTVCFLAVGLLGMASTGDAFNLYVFMEITALAGYGLIAAGEGKGPIAAFRYLLMGTIGASFYLLGVGFLYAATGTLNMADLAEKLVDMQSSPIVIVAIASMMVGFGIKMALFPLHQWQPAAHSYAHESADPMIAGIMIKVPAYAMIRFFYCIMQNSSETMEMFRILLSILAICGILYGSLKALRYNFYNKILAFSSVGQVGYIAMGIALGNYYGLVGAVLHIVSHAFMKSGLFYTSGALRHRFGIKDTTDMGQMYRKLPVTGAAMVVFALSMIGLPPFAGFFSKWYLALGAIQEGKYIFVVVLIVSSLLNAVYFFRLLEHLFMDKPAPVEDEDLVTYGPREAVAAAMGSSAEGTSSVATKKRRLELPWQMLVPIATCALAVICIGLFQTYIVTYLLKSCLLEVFL